MDSIQKPKGKDTTWLEDAKWRHANADWLDLSAAIAIKILRFLREHKITQKELADRLGFSPQHLSKIVKGSENLTLETICKIQKALGIPLIEVPGFAPKDEPESEVPLSDNYPF
jgi:DNA-binding Xre family transcriptional regulator